MELTLVHLYPDLLNIYGDQGNVAALNYRCAQRGIKLKLKNLGAGEVLVAGSFDLIFGGGGQDSQQASVSRYLPGQSAVLKQAARRGVPMLTICGSYQLFGRYFKPFTGPILKGIGIFPAYTVASKTRKIGNIVITTSLGKLVGFENHSGNTFLDQPGLALGRVMAGNGNNGTDQTEGCRVNNVFGCYLHGSLLPKNPPLADYLITTALELKYRRQINLRPLDDRLEWQAHQTAVKICLKSGWRNW
ncbi:glutamine amidotransferase [Candidatus Beckwithbacteria bacterium CG_4_10_14_0_2_um_filter_47_25]|uniref:Lipid II isoglutaminyl synthase (glutamine-hydrolyzing) subunit GatD n=1 Tax=Candidatus Beckwithbacteria bacterium CG_4_10_14_0_2_um_filter_47_25 TaxID=1974493 RepID=A0A2M7W6Z2_9BACT|nr:MAG: glutamine amidotransferase [Candidatus Beckwithbacteria bacterium CG_4_10_14_0_2_um_filter_47_25]